MKKVVIKHALTDKISKEFDVTNKSDSSIGQLMSGISINLNHSEYYVTLDTDEVIEQCPLESYQRKKHGIELFGEDTQFNQKINDAKDKYINEHITRHV